MKGGSSARTERMSFVSTPVASACFTADASGTARITAGCVAVTVCDG